MENASKALLMGAGMLIGILIASLFAYEFISISQTGNTYKQQLELKAIEEFNAKFIKYEGIELKPQEIITICNYINEWNEQNPISPIEYETRNADIKKILLKQVSTEDFLNNSNRRKI